MKKEKINNVIFPIYLIWIMPQVFWIIAILNFIIDSIVIIVTEKILKVNNILKNYKKCILKVWGFGFLADFIGAILLIGISGILGSFDISFVYNIGYNPFGNIYALMITFFTVAISGILIYVFNRKICFKKLDLTEKQKVVLSLVMAIFTAPYLFLMPVIP